jgi:hypothetical protein
LLSKPLVLADKVLEAPEEVMDNKTEKKPFRKEKESDGF